MLPDLPMVLALSVFSGFPNVFEYEPYLPCEAPACPEGPGTMRPGCQTKPSAKAHQHVSIAGVTVNTHMCIYFQNLHPACRSSVGLSPLLCTCTQPFPFLVSSADLAAA